MNLAVATVMGLVIAVQSVMPVMAAEVAPRALVTCSTCKEPVYTNEERYRTGEKELGDCNRSDHVKGCKIYEVTYRVIVSHVCKNGHSTEVERYYEYKSEHRSYAR